MRKYQDKNKYQILYTLRRGSQNQKIYPGGCSSGSLNIEKMSDICQIYEDLDAQANAIYIDKKLPEYSSASNAHLESIKWIYPDWKKSNSWAMMKKNWWNWRYFKVYLQKNSLKEKKPLQAD